MKKLLSGNVALARGLYEAGVNFASAYPGTPSTEITEALSLYDDIHSEWAPNEKVAMEACFGASIAGSRAFCAMKHVGLNVAADPLFTLSYTGVNAGLVICVADDPGMHSSQNEQDSRFYAMSARVPMLEPSNAQEAYNFAKLAFEMSEEYDTPVIIKMCTRVSHTLSLVETGERIEHKFKPMQDVCKNVMVPANAINKHPLVEKRICELQKFSEDFVENFIDSGNDNSQGFICDSTSYNYVKEVIGDEYPVFKISMVYPLPKSKIIEFSSEVGELIIVEELGDFIEMQLKSWAIKCIGKELFGRCGEFSQASIASALSLPEKKHKRFEDVIPNRPPALCPGCPHRGIFYSLAKLKLNVFGDIGCYTLAAAPPLSALHTALCMGASISGLHGYAKCSDNKSVAVIGDSTFIHSGITSLIEVSYNKSNSTVIILDNSITGMTGHQNNPANGLNIKGEASGQVDLESLCKSVGINRVRVIDPYNLNECLEAIKEEIKKDEASIIISRRPCVLLKQVEKKPPLIVDRDKCIGCKACMKLTCPAISIRGGKANIDTSLCVGCEVCTQLCKFGALNVEEVPNE